MDYPGRLIAGLIAVVLIILFPLQYIAQSNSENIDYLVDERTQKLANTMRDKGFIDKKMYEEYMSFLDTTGERYDVEFQDIKPVKGEEYSYEDNGKSNRMAFFKRVSHSEIVSFATHTHTDDCYGGHKHTGEPIFVHTHQHTSSCVEFVSSWYHDYTCLNCGSPNHRFLISYYWDEATHSVKLGMQNPGTAECMLCGSRNISEPIERKNYDYSCGYSIDVDNDGYSDPVGRTQSYQYEKQYPQDRTVKSTTVKGCYKYHQHAIFPYQGINAYGNRYYIASNLYEARNKGGLTSYCSAPRVFQVVWFVDANIQYRITYIASPGTNTLNLSSSSSTANPSVPYPATMTFHDFVNIMTYEYDAERFFKKHFNRSTLDFRSNSITCTGEISNCNETVHNTWYTTCGLEEDTTPDCHNVVTSISATPATQTVDKGKPISLTVTANYLDGHSAPITNYTTNYNPNLATTQTVTITYNGLVGNAKTIGTITCKVIVTVRLVNILSSITALPSSQTVSRYSSPSFTVRAYYSDDTNRLLNSSEYIMEGFNSASLGLQNVTISYTENGVKKTATVKVIVIAQQKECPKCNQLYELNPDDTDPGCPFCKEIITGIEVTPAYVELTQGESLPITVMGIYKDGSKRTVSGWSSNYNPDRLGLQIVTIEYDGHAKDITVWVNDELIACPICNTNYPKSESKCPVCAEKVVSISASPREVTIMQYENIPLTVTAIYADGSSREVDEWSIDRTSMVPGTFNATVSYKGVTDIITLTVLSYNSIECPICETVYDLIDNPTGCPICSRELIGIEAYLTSGTNLVQLGTTPNIAIILIFRDEHREFTSDGYSLEDFKAHELGIQSIRVIYKEFTTTIVVEVVNMLDTITCPNGHVYHKNEDDTDPGCPFCHIAEDISKILYFDITYTPEILDAVYSTGAYHFQKGNYISIIVIKKDKSLLYRLQNTFFSTSMLGRKKRFIYGGEVY